MKVLVLGASGMLGNAVVRLLSENSAWQVYGTVRNESVKRFFTADIAGRLIAGVDVEQQDSLTAAYARTRPNVVINCIGVVKQLDEANDPLRSVPINTLLPHRLARLCDLAGARLVHLSTDCVFAGTRGMYAEQDVPDAHDLYGRSKLLGEVDYPNAVTLRTSIIGHELCSAHGLVGWFLAQQGPVRGFSRAIFSGLPTVELARAIRDFVLPNPDLHGVYHVSAEPISKHDLLKLVAAAYGRDTSIAPDDSLVVDRSLNSQRFRAATGYSPLPWPQMVQAMRAFG